jgi:hypothetical protein
MAGGKDPVKAANGGPQRTLQDQWFDAQSEITVDAHYLVDQIAQLFVRGGVIRTLSTRDLKIAEGHAENAWQLVELGTPALDAIIYFTLSEKQKKTVAKRKCSPHTELARLPQVLFTSVFTYLVTSKFPEDQEDPYPAFVTRILPQGEFLKLRGLLSNFSLEQLDPNWVTAFPFHGLDTASLTRIQLGIAGYRWLKAVAMVPLSEDLSEKEHDFAEMTQANIKSIVAAPPSWDVFPPTKGGTKVGTWLGTVRTRAVSFLKEMADEKAVTEMIKQKKIRDYNADNTECEEGEWKAWMSKPDMSGMRLVVAHKV